MKVRRVIAVIFFFLLTMFLLVSCNTEEKLSPQNSLMLKYFNEPIPKTMYREPNFRKINKIHTFDPLDNSAFQVDLRYADLRYAMLQESIDSLLHSAFNTATVWPDILPDGF